MAMVLNPKQNTQARTSALPPTTAQISQPSRDNGKARDKRVLAERAARLAEQLQQDETGAQIALLLVRLGREVYGLEAHHVDRVQLAEQITPVPRVPGWVVGMTNLRGQLLSVVDLAGFFGLPSTARDALAAASGEPESAPCLVIVSAPTFEVALLIDGVLGVERIPSSRLQDAETIARGLRPEYVRGVVQRTGSAPTNGGGHHDLVVVLDLQAVLGDERLVIHDEII